MKLPDYMIEALRAAQEKLAAEGPVCPGCGSTAKDRGGEPLLVCPHCGGDKCRKCDAGDNVPCSSCEEDECG